MSTGPWFHDPGRRTDYQPSDAPSTSATASCSRSCSRRFSARPGTSTTTSPRSLRPTKRSSASSRPARVGHRLHREAEPPPDRGHRHLGRRPEQLLEAGGVESAAWGRKLKIPPPPLSRTTRVQRSGRAVAQRGTSAETSCRKARSPDERRRPGRAPPAATPSAVEITAVDPVRAPVGQDPRRVGRGRPRTTRGRGPASRRRRTTGSCEPTSAEEAAGDRRLGQRARRAASASVSSASSIARWAACLGGAPSVAASRRRPAAPPRPSAAAEPGVRVDPVRTSAPPGRGRTSAPRLDRHHRGPRAGRRRRRTRPATFDAHGRAEERRPPRGARAARTSGSAQDGVGRRRRPPGARGRQPDRGSASTGQPRPVGQAEDELRRPARRRRRRARPAARPAIDAGDVDGPVAAGDRRRGQGRPSARPGGQRAGRADQRLVEGQVEVDRTRTASTGLGARHAGASERHHGGRAGRRGRPGSTRQRTARAEQARPGRSSAAPRRRGARAGGRRCTR